MKTYMICAILCGIGFFAMAMQLGLLSPGSDQVVAADDEYEEEGDDVEAEEQAPVKPKRLRFPIDLAGVAKAEAMPQAKQFRAADEPHKMLFLKVTGSLHEWQDSLSGYNPEWEATGVEETELVVVVGAQRKTKVSYHEYPNGAPPVTRYEFALEASLIEAKTGRVLAHRRFVNIPRPLRDREAWELTTIGRPVQYRSVFRWASAIAKYGQPTTVDTSPIVNVVGDD